MQDMLSLARRGVLTKTVLNLNEVIRDYINSLEFKRMMENYPAVHLEINLAESVGNIIGSSSHLQKVLMNLIINALEATKGVGKLTLSTENIRLDKVLYAYEPIKPGYYLCMSVSDTGEGIPENILLNIFEPFFTTKVMGKSGSGLGLAVVWGTIKDHEGYIDVKSSPHEGTCFRVFIPAVADHITFTGNQSLTEEIQGKGETILVIDDEDEQRELAFQILTSFGYSMHTSSNWQDALSFLKVNKVDLILLDMVMGSDIDGLDIYRHIYQINPNQKVIIISGFAQSNRVTEALKLGANAFVQKPYIPIDLARAVRETLNSI